MKNRCLLILITLLLGACQKVINVDLNAANPQVVIEGAVFEGSHEVKVRVTRTTSYFTGGGAIPTIDNALVLLSDQINPAVTLLPIGDGWYSYPNYTANVKINYQLSVSVEGKEYKANAYLPEAPFIDSISYKKFKSLFGGGKEEYLMTAHFQDSASVKNYYQIIVSKNNAVQNKPSDLYLFDDQVRDGQYIDVPIFSTLCDLNDTLDIEMRCMDAKVYDYFTTLEDALSGDANNSAAPANPNTNFSNGALGYFGAFSTQKRSLRIQ